MVQNFIKNRKKLYFIYLIKIIVYLGDYKKYIDKISNYLLKPNSFVYGICLGMQLLLEESEEFVNTAGLGLIPGRVIPVPAQTLSGETQKIPHIGWNSLQSSGEISGWHGTLLQDNQPSESVYFVHS